MSWFDDAEKQMDEREQEEVLREKQRKWKPEEEGDTLLGILTQAKTTPDTGYGVGLLCIVKDMKEKDEDGDPIQWEVWGSGVVLRNELFDQAPALGKGIMIRYAGKQEGQSGFSYSKYYVEVEKDKNGIPFQDRQLWDKLHREYEMNRESDAPAVDPVQSATDDDGNLAAPF